VNVTEIATDLKDHIEQGEAWFAKVLEQHVPALLAEGQKLSGSKIVQALLDLGEVILPPETEQAIADLIRNFAAYAATAGTAAAAPPQAPGEASVPAADPARAAVPTGS
jgi:hypothetical protein